MFKKILNFMNDDMVFYYDRSYPIEKGYTENEKVLCTKWRARRRLVADWWRLCYRQGLSKYF